MPGDSGGDGPEPDPTPSGGGGGCEQVGTWSMRTLIAWEPEKMSEVVRIVADLGRTEVEPGVPDVMTELPTGSASDGASDPPPAVPDSAVGEFPGFLGEYLVGEAGVFYAVEGSAEQRCDRDRPASAPNARSRWIGPASSVRPRSIVSSSTCGPR